MMRSVAAFVFLLIMCGIGGCGIGPQPLMPTPVLYTQTGLSPLGHIPEAEQWIPRRIFYATNRDRAGGEQRIEYGNSPSSTVSVGMGLVGFGDPHLTWSALHDASAVVSRDPEIILSISGIMEKGRFDPAAAPETSAGPSYAGFMLRSLRQAIAAARDKDVLIYVHGAKVNFYNACVFAAQLDHFAGRDLTSVAFAWPTRQNIFAYASGGDIERAYTSATALAALIELIADHTDAERIHVLSWSAGARVAMTAAHQLATKDDRLTEDERRARYRIGTLYFAAGDLPVSQFSSEIDAVHGLADQIVVTQSDRDMALKSAQRFMRGGARIGQAVREITPQQANRLAHLPRLEIVDVSAGAEQRGFDITGHRYWFNHPWVSTDVVLTIRSTLSPAQRGLEAGGTPGLWAIPADYPDRVEEIVRRHLGGS